MRPARSRGGAVDLSLEKPEAARVLAARAGLAAGDLCGEQVAASIATIAGALPPATNRAVVLRAAAELPALARPLVFPGHRRVLEAPQHLHGTPRCFEAGSREAVSLDLHLLDLADGLLCHVADMPLVLTADGKTVVRDYSSRYAALVHYYDIDLRRLIADAVVVPETVILIADDVRPPNFSHWLLDWLPRLACLYGFASRAQCRVAVPTLPAASYLRETLRLCGFAGDRIIELGRTQAVRARRLLVPSDLPVAPHPGHKGAPWLLAYLRDRMLQGAAFPGPERRKLLVSREGAGGRQMQGEATLLQRLAPFGYHRIVTGQMEFAEQVAAFAAASHIIAAHGAALALLAFAAPGTQVLEIFPESYGTAAYYVLASSLGLRYASYVAAPIAGARGQLDDIALDPAHLLDVARACL